METTLAPKLVTPARFFAGGLTGYGETLAESQRTGSIINPAEVEYNGVRLFSSVPQSAAEAERINKALR
jgi:hypothetical protein